MEFADCEEHVRVIQVEAGIITTLESFKIEVKERQINIKSFFN